MYCAVRVHFVDDALRSILGFERRVGGSKDEIFHFEDGVFPASTPPRA